MEIKLTKSEIIIVTKWMKKSKISTALTPRVLINDEDRFLILLAGEKRLTKTKTQTIQTSQIHKLDIPEEDFYYLVNEIRKARLQILLDKAIEYENYERASIFRDKIKQLNEI